MMAVQSHGLSSKMMALITSVNTVAVQSPRVLWRTLKQAAAGRIETAVAAAAAAQIEEEAAAALAAAAAAAGTAMGEAAAAAAAAGSRSGPGSGPGAQKVLRPSGKQRTHAAGAAAALPPFAACALMPWRGLGTALSTAVPLPVHYLSVNCLVTALPLLFHWPVTASSLPRCRGRFQARRHRSSTHVSRKTQTAARRRGMPFRETPRETPTCLLCATTNPPSPLVCVLSVQSRTQSRE